MKNLLSQLVEQAIIEWLKGKDILDPFDTRELVQAVPAGIASVYRDRNEWLGEHVVVEFYDKNYGNADYKYQGSLAEFWFEVVGL